MTHAERKRHLAERLTPEFLSTLAEAARVRGHDGDYVETEDFVRAMFFLAGAELPDLEPYEIDEDE